MPIRAGRDRGAPSASLIARISYDRMAAVAFSSAFDRFTAERKHAIVTYPLFQALKPANAFLVASESPNTLSGPSAPRNLALQLM
jgi:hypothetical protein